MSKLPIEKRRADEMAFLQDVQRKHPERSSRCGALLSEIKHGADLSARTRAARAFGNFHCRRGLKVLVNLVADVRQEIETRFGHDGFPAGPERYFLGALLFAVARMESAASHAFLKDCLSSFKNPHLQSDVLEFMAFEDERFETGLIDPYLAEQTSEPILLSALYAVLLNSTSFDPAESRNRIAPLLKSDSANVREYAVRALMNHEANLDVIRPLADDAHPMVRDAVAEALRWIEGLGNDLESNHERNSTQIICSDRRRDG